MPIHIAYSHWLVIIKTSIFKITKLLFALILFNSCEKDEYELPEEPVCINSSFSIGYDNNCMDITTFVSVMTPIPHEPRFREDHVELDIDKDGVIDFKIQCVHEMLPHSGIEFKRSSIETVNTTFEISVIEMLDIVHICMDTNNHYYLSVIYNNHSNYSCFGEDRKDTIISSSIISYPKGYYMAGTITQRESWLNGEFFLAYSYIASGMTSNPKSIIRGTWLGGQDNKYILFRKDSNGAYLYGWLKLGISSFTTIYLYEYAIQKRSIE